MDTLRQDWSSLQSGDLNITKRNCVSTMILRAECGWGFMEAESGGLTNCLYVRHLGHEQEEVLLFGTFIWDDDIQQSGY
jgi:hypothetical protein